MSESITGHINEIDNVIEKIRKDYINSWIDGHNQGVKEVEQSIIQGCMEGLSDELVKALEKMKHEAYQKGFNEAKETAITGIYRQFRELELFEG